jgi:hypothetical protein
MQPNLLRTVASRSALRRNSHTDGACFPGNEQEFFIYRSHQRTASYRTHLAACLGSVLHSAIVTDLTMERLPDPLQLSCLESRICFKAKTVTRTERASQGKNKNSFITGHTNGVAPRSREEHSPALVELTYNGVIRLPWSLVFTP